MVLRMWLERRRRYRVEKGQKTSSRWRPSAAARPKKSLTAASPPFSYMLKSKKVVKTVRSISVLHMRLSCWRPSLTSSLACKTPGRKKVSVRQATRPRQHGHRTPRFRPGRMPLQPTAKGLGLSAKDARAAVHLGRHVTLGKVLGNEATARAREHGR